MSTLKALGTPEAAVCIDGVCQIPGASDGSGVSGAETVGDVSVAAPAGLPD